MRTLLSITLALGLLAAFTLTAAADTDVTGTWSGSFKITGPNGETNDSTSYMVLKQNGSEITGTAGPNESEQYQITKGKIEGGKIPLETDAEGHSVKFDLVLAGDRITGEANLSGNGATAKAKLDLTRVK